MNIQQAIDDFLLYLKIEKNYSEHTFNGYSYDLKSFETFLETHRRSMDLAEINRSTVRRYIQDQVSTHKIKPRTINRRISCLKSFSKYCLNEKLILNDFMAGVESPKMDEKLPFPKKLFFP